MKRYGRLMGLISSQDNLLLAFHKARRKKWLRPSVIAFQENLSSELELLQVEMCMLTYRPGAYTRFVIRDPKERTICAAPFRDRVLQHAIMNICEPIFEQGLIEHTYACRRRKGHWAAIQQARSFHRAHVDGWFLKMDIRKYYDSICHLLLFDRLESRIKDIALLTLFKRILSSYETKRLRGLPIGNLTSQHWGNFYLNPLDRFIKETLRIKSYVRYMDDFVLWHSDKNRLCRTACEIESFLGETLCLKVKPDWKLNRTCCGVNFLGYRLLPGRLKLTHRSKKRFQQKFRKYEANFIEGVWTEQELQAHMLPLLDFVIRADTLGLRCKELQREGRLPDGL